MNRHLLSPLGLLLVGLHVTSVFSQQTTDPKDLIGIWEQRGYGRTVHIKESDFILYERTQNTCVLAERGPIAYLEQFGSLALPEEDLLTLTAGINTYYFDRLDQLPERCSTIDFSKGKDPIYNFEVVWNTFQDHYVYFDRREVDWDSYRTKYLPKVLAVSNEVELYRVFNSMLESLGDGHVGISAPHKIEKKAYKKEPKPATSTTSVPDLRRSARRLVLERYLDNYQEYHKGVIRWGAINEDLGYVQINAMVRYAEYGISEELKSRKYWKAYFKQASQDPKRLKSEVAGTRSIMERVLKEMGDKKALILDIRFNGGGTDEVSIEIMNHFTDQRRFAFSKKARNGDGFLPSQEIYLEPRNEPYLKPVYVLTSGETASAAEIMTLCTMVLPQVTRVGSPTEGVFSDILGKSLPNGWEFGLSNEIYESVEGVDYENQGIPAEKAIPYSQDTRSFYESLQNIEKEGDSAIEWVMGEVK